MTDISDHVTEHDGRSAGSDYESAFLERAYRALLTHGDFGGQLRDLAETARAHTGCERVVIERAEFLAPDLEPVEALLGPWASSEPDPFDFDEQPSLRMPVVSDGVAQHVMTFYKSGSPGRFSPHELEHARRLSDLAGLIVAGAARAEMVGRLLETDNGPAVASRNDFEEEVAFALENNHGQAGFLIVRIDDLGEVNQHHGREVGDEVLRLIARTMREAIGSWGSVGRVRRHEFGVILPGANYGEVDELARTLDKAFENPLPVLGRADVTASIAIGVAVATAGDSCAVLPLFHAAYTSLERGTGTRRRRGSRWLIP